MSRICELVGDIGSDEPELVFTHGDKEMGDEEEKFYSVPFHIYSAVIPLLVSEHHLEMIQPGHAIVKGALMSLYKKKNLPRFYFNANSIARVEPDVQATNTVSFIGTITKIRPITTDNAGRDVFTVTISDISPLGEASILFIAFRSEMARKYKNLALHQKICGEGYLKPYRSTYEVYANSIQIL